MQLTARKLTPTPLNYQLLYNEIANIPNVQPFPEEPLRQIAAELPVKNPGQEKQLALLASAVSRRSWAGVQNALVAYVGFATPTSAAAGGSAGGAATQPGALSALGANPVAAAAPALTADFLEQIARLIEHTQPALGTDDTRFAEQTQAVVNAMRQPGADLMAAKMLLGNYSHRLSFAAEDQAEIKANLLRLLHLIFQNIGELSLDDRWLKGQIDGLMLASTPPLSLRRLDDLERRLKDVIFKQTEAKGRALEAQEEMRLMLLTFIERLSQMSDSTSVFQVKLEENARLIEQAKTLAEIAPVLKDVVGATRGMANDSLNTRDELRTMRQKTLTNDAEIIKLHQELDRVSNQARHDTLTGALNRKGLDEAVNREVSNFRRKDIPLSVGLLDIDNFKMLNDRLGHATGDAALAHLAQVARDCMRPQDTLARYGGEEFVILLPDTPLDRGIDAMTRLQRELTRHFFLAGAEKIMITFSAGVAQLAPDETGEEAIKRADQAMYLAKRAGKNRVLGA
ncbi:MAG: hypothetical protein RIS34_180 [Pseudomonadota bacterium]